MNRQFQGLPMFPLNILPFPGEQAALHIFEPRYRELLSDIEASGGLFAIPFPESKGKMSYCSVVSLVTVSKRHPGGESDIVIVGEFIGRVTHFEDPAPAKLYAVGDVELADGFAETEAGTIVRKELEELRQVIGPKADVLLGNEYRLLHVIVSSLGLAPEQKLSFLKLRTETARQRYVSNLLRFTRLIVSQEKKIENGVFPN